MLGKPTVAVAYLARSADGATSFERFIRSYGQFAAGIPHDLVVLYKGFGTRADLARANRTFDGAAHSGIELPDVGFDIGSYIECSKRLPHEYICFLNTHTEILSDGWLAHLVRHSARADVGVAGASGSYESLKWSWRLIQKYYWLYYLRGVRYPNNVDRYYVKFRDYLPGQPQYPQHRWIQYAPPYAYVRGVERWARTTLEHLRFIRYWQAMTRPGAVLNEISAFPDFPNPHIRSNGFVVKRQHMPVMQGFRIRTKNDACMFESGADSLTARLRRAGLSAVIVGRDGEGYEVPQWPQSATFRLGGQSNLMLGDNHSRWFVEMTEESKFTHRYITWGDYIGARPKDFPTLGIRFKKGSLAPRPRRV